MTRYGPIPKPDAKRQKVTFACSAAVVEQIDAFCIRGGYMVMSHSEAALTLVEWGLKVYRSDADTFKKIVEG